MEPKAASFQTSLGKTVFTFWPKTEHFPQSFQNNMKHNKIIDPEYTYVLAGEADFEDVLDKKAPNRKALIELYNKTIIPEVRSHLFRYAFLYRYGGWYFDPEIYQMKSLDRFEEISTALFCYDSDKRPSLALMKFESKHPAMLAMLSAIAQNYENELHLHNVLWFSGNLLLSAITSRKFEFEVKRFDFDHYVNFAGCTFATSENSKREDWRLLQCFGIIEGLRPDFDHMPKRLTYDQADLVVEHMQNFHLENYAHELRAKHPVYFEENAILKTLL